MENIYTDYRRRTQKKCRPNFSTYTNRDLAPFIYNPETDIYKNVLKGEEDERECKDIGRCSSENRGLFYTHFY